MAKQRSGQLSLTKAAQIVFRSRNPSKSQIATLEKAIEKRFLRSERTSGKWTVSTESLSDFLATQACEVAQKQAARHRQQNENGKVTAKTKASDKAVPITGNPSLEERFLKTKQPELQATIFDTSRDVILAVLMRRNMKMRSSRFKVTVVALQITLVCTVIAASLWAVKPLWTGIPGEQKAVMAWLEDEYPEGYRITEWGDLKRAMDPKAIQFRVKFSYKRSTSRGWVKTDRIFTIEDNQVTNAAMEDD